MSFFNQFNPVVSRKQPSKHPWDRSIKTEYSKTYKHGHNSAKNSIYLPKKEKLPIVKHPVRFTVIGNRLTSEFIYCLNLVKGLHRYRKTKFKAPVIRGVTSIEWPKVWNDLKIEYGNKAHCLESEVAVLIDDTFLGGEKELREFIESRYEYHLSLDYYKEKIQQFANFINSYGRPCAYLHISVDGKPIGSLIFMLYADIVPRTCQNFLQLCEATRGGYAGTPIHRIVKDCWIQCGGFGLKNKPELDCENFIVPHDKRGVLGMANDGRHIDCSTQFFVLLQPATWMAHKYVAFGQLIEGEKTLKSIENVSTWYESPTAEISIYKAGVFNMDCQRMPINKNTNEYLEGHIDNITPFIDMLYEEMLQKVFAEARLRYLNRLQQELEEIEEESSTDAYSAKDVHTTDRFVSKKDEIGGLIKTITGANTSASKGTSENNDFCMDDDYEYEFDEYSAAKTSLASVEKVRPVKLHFVPLTDVPYPGEVDSAFDLHKLLNGDYCFEKDLEKDVISRRKQKNNALRRPSIPKQVLDALFGYYDYENDESVMSLNSFDEDAIKTYLEENLDAVSFAGPVLKKIAGLHEKYKVFTAIKHKTKERELITDEQLRLMRMAIKQHEATRKAKVSISMMGKQKTATKIRRRVTGFVSKDDLANLDSFRASAMRVNHDEDNEDKDSRKVRIVAGAKTHERSEIHRRPTGYISAPQELELETMRPSVLARLFQETAPDSDDDDGPTLKNYRPYTEEKERSFVLLTNSPTSLFNHHDRLPRRSSITGGRSAESMLDLQHGVRVSCKISSDYFKTIQNIEDAQARSLRSIEYAKVRPSISVLEYQRKNKIYQEEKLKDISAANTQSNIEKTSGSTVLRPTSAPATIDTVMSTVGMTMSQSDEESLGSTTGRMF